MITHAQESDADPAAARSEGRWALAALGLAALLLIFARTVTDPDLWGHLRFGLDTLEIGQIIRPDPYSYLTGAQLWYNHEWLAEAIFALAYRAAGATGLQFLKLSIALATGLIMFTELRRSGLAPTRAWIVVVLPAALLAIGAGTIRPHLFTYLGFAILLAALARVDAGDRRWLLALPPLFLAWVNLHGGFLAGIAILVVWATVSVAQRIVRRRRDGVAPAGSAWPIAAVALASLIATLGNPYGLDHWRFLLETATVARPEISEWQPLLLLSGAGALYAALLAAGVTAFALARTRPDPFRLVAFAGLALAPMLALRHAPLFAIAMPMLTAPALAAAWARLRPESARPVKPRLARLMTLVSLIAAVMLLIAAAARGRCIAVEPNYYPNAAVSALQAAGATGNLAVHFNWGEYLIWHLGPQIKVSVDGRRETVYTPTVYKQNLDFMRGTGAWDALLADGRTDYALVPADGPTANLLKLSPGWTLALEDALAALFVAEPVGDDALARLRAAAPAQEQCFR